MINLYDSIDINGENFFKVIKQVCPHCHQVNCYINAEHIDSDYRLDLIEYLKNELKRAKGIVMGYEAFCQEYSLQFELVYELRKLKDKFNNNHGKDEIR